ncbi:CDF zinc transporter, partial [Ramaria rubella]
MRTTTRFAIILGISVTFFCVEIAVGFRTKSLALIADAFHYLNDVVAYVIGFVASHVQNKGDSPSGYTYAYHRAELVGAFFNSVFLLALGLSIFLQSLERFINIDPVTDPLSVLIVGCIGLALNIISAFVIHDHSHAGGGHHDHPKKDIMITCHDEITTTTSTSQPSEVGNAHDLHNHVRLPPPGGQHRNLGVLAALIHVLGDAVNNVGVIIAAVIMWQTHSPARFYADPAVSLAISLMIFTSAIPLTKAAGRILLEASPPHLDLDHIKQDLLAVNSVLSIRDLHVWQLSQSVTLGSFRVRVPVSTTLDQWMQVERTLRECMAAYGATHVTVAPES